LAWVELSFGKDSCVRMPLLEHLNTVIREADCDLPAGSNYVNDLSIYSAEDTLLRICEGTWALIVVDTCSEDGSSLSSLPVYIVRRWELDDFDFECEHCGRIDYSGWSDRYDYFYCEICWRPYLTSHRYN
jgi:hypothetical protein